MNESEIKATDLESTKSNYYNYLYFSAIAINKDYRNLKTLRELIELTKKRLISVINQNYEIKEVMADCSTKEGEKIAQKFLHLTPFMKTSHGSTIHILKGSKFIKNIK